MTTHTPTIHEVPAAWFHEEYTGAVHAMTKVHENEHGEFFEHVRFVWTGDRPSSSNSRFALVVTPSRGGPPFMFARSSVIARRLYEHDAPVVEFTTGDILAIEDVGRYRILAGPPLHHGVVLEPAPDEEA